MTASLKAWIDRLDAATLRERVLVFVALTLVLVFIVNAVLIDPLRTREKALSAENQKLQAELRGIEAALQRLVQGGTADVDAENRAKLKQARADLERLNARVADEQRRFTPPERMRAVLQEIFERNTALTLIEMQSLPAQPLPEAPGLFRHGIELSVSGSYGDLYEYLRALETLPTQLYWGRAEISVAAHPRVILKLTVYTASFDRTWLTV
jgi:MSHA biogenesis protein MshJ